MDFEYESKFGEVAIGSPFAAVAGRWFAPPTIAYAATADASAEHVTSANVTLIEPLELVQFT